MKEELLIKEKQNTNNNLDQKFQDIEGVSMNKLNFGLWYIEHIKYFRLILIICLIIIAVISWTYVIYGFVYYFAYGINEDEKMVKQMVETKIIDHNYLSQSVNKDLIIYSTQALRASNKKYDLLVQIKNTNSKLYGKFNYYFLVDGKKTIQQSGFIFPNESKYLFILAQDFSYQPNNIQLIIENLNWFKINREKIFNWQDYYDNHSDIINTDIKFIPASKSELSQNQLSYNSRNKTPYNYFQVDYLILFFNNNSIVNIEKYTLTDFMSGQTRLIQLNWSGNVSNVDEIKIISDMNILDKNIYIKYEGKVQSGDQFKK